ncbi:MAG: hypothetical protein LUI10_10860 [Lachnospiraceae bacterium]|nr:hypothetical protein [Lachnospiraceae bacterium]
MKALKMDLKRAFCSWKFPVSVLLGAAVCGFTLLFCTHYISSTVHRYVYIHDRSQIFLAYIVGLLPYSTCIYDDFSYGNIRNNLGRVSPKVYVRAKVVAALLSTMAAFILGKLLFVFIHSRFQPVGTADTASGLAGSLLYYNLIVNGKYWFFLVMSSFHKSLYCLVLCMLVLLFSIWIHNLSVMYSVPVAAYYVLTFYVNGHLKADYLNLAMILGGTYGVWGNDVADLVYALAVTALLCYLLYRAILWSIRKKVSQ